VWVALVCLAALGCNGAPRPIEPPEFRDDFGEELGETEITEESVGREQMLKRRTQVELRAGVVSPIESNLDPGGGVGIKGEIETFKNLYFGLSFDFAHLESDEQISDNVQNANVSALLNADPTELFESLDRYNILALFDYDVPLVKNFSFRFGVGAGLAIITFDEGKNSDVFLGGYDVEPFYSFVLRPAIDFRLQVWEHGYVAVGASFDFLPSGKIEIKPGDEDRSEVDESVNFSSLNAGVAWVFEW
jgi:hypothetical protein